MLDVIGAGATAASTQDWFVVTFIHVDDILIPSRDAIWRKSSESSEVRQELERIHAGGKARGAVAAEFNAEFATPWTQQAASLLRRDIRFRWRNPTYLMAKLLLNIAAGLFIGFTFFKAKSTQQGTQDQLFAIYMSTILAAPLSNQLQVPFLEMRKIYEIREGPTKFYSWTALITSSFLSELPWNIVGSSLYFLCWYWTVGFDTDRAGYTYLVLGVVFPLYYTSLAQAVASMAPNTEIAAVLFSFLFSFIMTFNGVLQPFRQLGWWKWMYRVSPFTYLIEGLLGQALGKHSITCSSVELVRLNPPSGQTCAAYMAPYISFAGGYLTPETQNATSGCEFCSTATTDQLLERNFNIFYSHHWRDLGLLFAYIGFNIFALYWMTYVFHLSFSVRDSAKLHSSVNVAQQAKHAACMRRHLVGSEHCCPTACLPAGGYIYWKGVWSSAPPPLSPMEMEVQASSSGHAAQSAEAVDPQAVGLFHDASGFDIHGGQFISAQGGVHIHSHPEPPASLPSAPAPSEEADPIICSDAEVYWSQLCRRRRGFPLYVPEPQVASLPPEYLINGVSIGDVGMVTEEGIWDFFFNIFLPEDHPINQGRTPPGFIPLKAHASANVYRLSFWPGTFVASPSAVQNMSFQQFPGGQYLFQCSPPRGAILCLPYGSQLERMARQTEHVRTYAARNAKSWYTYINGELGTGIANGQLYLITGWEKAIAGGIATFQGLRDSFELACRPQSQNPGSAYQFSHDTPSKPFPAQISHDFPDIPEANALNNTIFLRGFTISLGLGVWSALLGDVEIDPLEEPTSHKTHNPMIPFSSQPSGLSSFLGFYSQPGTSSKSRQYLDQHREDIVLRDLNSAPKLMHPARAMNEHILRTIPQVSVVIMHDDNWEIAMEDPTINFADPVQLGAQLVEYCELQFEDGVVYSSSTSIPADLVFKSYNDLSTWPGNRGGYSNRSTSSDTNKRVTNVNIQISQPHQVVQEENTIASSPSSLQAPATGHTNLYQKFGGKKVAISDAESSDSSDTESTASSFDELLPEELPDFFVERENRLFSSLTTSPYPLPVDTPEQERQKVLHKLLFDVIGAHYPSNCPVQAVLAPDPARRRYALDLCTGTGKWAIDMARDFPHLINLLPVPIAPQLNLPPNVNFVMHDVNIPAPWAAGTFDLIHARSISMAVFNYSELLAECARLLRPGGAFISGEWSNMVFTMASPTPGAEPVPIPITIQLAPFIHEFFSALHTSLQTPPNPLPPTAPLMAPLLAVRQQFFVQNTITSASHLFPLGGWHPDPAMQRTGRIFRNIFRRYMDSVRPLLDAKSGMPQAQLNQLYVEVHQEIRSVSGIWGVYNTVFAQRA
uniref:Pleiotropic drug resistance ABC transporter protein n=1 Tax=Mycena chlorophos TaxID=658473 RepID=A0ABQ0L3C4_MYCCL|nr:pleiotropic drug resistance ABC transporter protein [Mycena chlorophos]